jgi:hypothetical protein
VVGHVVVAEVVRVGGLGIQDHQLMHDDLRPPPYRDETITLRVTWELLLRTRDDTEGSDPSRSDALSSANPVVSSERLTADQRATEPQHVRLGLRVRSTKAG